MPDVVEYHVTLDGGVNKWSNRGRPSWVLGTGFDGDPGTPDGAPNAPQTVTAVKNPSTPTTQINVTWAAPVVDGSHAAQTGYRVYANSVQQGADRASGVTSTTLTGLTPGQVYAVTVRAFNASGVSASSQPVSVTLDGGSNPTVTMLMGCSDSANDHGGTEVWDGWRVYTSGAMTSRANRTGTQRPLFLAYSQGGGQNVGGANPNYTSVYNEVLAELNAFYYTGTAQSARWGIKLYWSNGNENSDKGALTLPHSQAKLDAYTTSQRALWDAVHYAPGGVRRFPDAYAGSNPTQNQELNGEVQGWLHQSAQWHDFVMWSMYPPGRQTTSEDPTYNWPSILESDAYNLRLGFLGRCFVRTLAAQAAARGATGNPDFNLMISCGEVGIGDSPGNQNARPYYAAHGLAAGMRKWSVRSGLAMPFTCWWDHQSDAGSPQNILTDEPGATSPSTREAWQNWTTYNHEYSGTHPGSWAGLPASIVKKTGPVV